ncbi:putative glutamate receptor [Frankliniella fusca]|uniref:Glutamate receptor n=1 Tax=Frankliniella fusca TaxID=407009 RepID=A0AAE1H9M9_9NEOP|nr:putative glutamate receptor [Frankliniella fusca]
MRPPCGFTLLAGATLLLLGAAPAARALPPVTDAGLPPEVACVAELLDAFLPPLNGSLVVEGDIALAPAGRSHFHRLAPQTPRVLMSLMRDTSELDNLKARHRVVMLVPLADVTQVGGFLSRLNIVLPSVRFVLWTRAATRPPVTLHMTAETPVFLCGLPIVLAVSSADGHTGLYVLDGNPPGCRQGLRSLGENHANLLVLTTNSFFFRGTRPHRPGLAFNVSRRDQCGSRQQGGGRSGWSRPVSEVAPRLCTTWSPPPAADDTYATTVVAEDPGPDHHLFRQLLTSVLAASRATISWSSWPGKVLDAQLRLDHCDVAMLVTLGVLDMEVSSHVHYVGPVPMRVTVLVPAGRGPRPLPLAAVTAEFSAELWAGTALALAAVSLALAAAWWCSGRGALAAALQAGALHAVAPLLAQAPPGATAHRPLYAVWLLASVVLAAAYQGLLLSELTRPPADIDSLEQLERSGLDVLLAHDLDRFATDFTSPALRPRVHRVESHEVAGALQRVAERQDAALIVRRTLLLSVELRRLSGEQRRRLHAFELPIHRLMAFALASTGSPMIEPVQRAILRAHEADLFRMYLERSARDLEAAGAAPAGWTRPLTLAEVTPALVLLAAGHCAAALVLLLEVLVHRLQLAAASAVLRWHLTAAGAAPASWTRPLTLAEVTPALVLLAAGHCAAALVLLLEVLVHRLQLVQCCAGT